MATHSNKNEWPNVEPRHNVQAQRAMQVVKKPLIGRRLRTVIVFLLFTSISLHRLNQDVAYDKYSETMRNYRVSGHNIIVPVVQREWDRMLFGIFTYDSPNEADLRSANRETHLSYFKHFYNNSNHDTKMMKLEEVRPDLICSLHELLNNSTLARDVESCRIVYSFVMGGAAGGSLDMRKKVDKYHLMKDITNTTFRVRTRCLWEDPDCGGTNINKWTLDVPKCNISDALAQELREHNDITFLNIPENHELGKSDTWFTYMSMLTWQYPELQIGFVGKIDSDNFIRWPLYLRYLRMYGKQHFDTTPFIYGGYAIHKKRCSKPMYKRMCANPNFIAECFAAGAHVYMSTILAQHVFMHGTTLKRKKEIWILGEDMQLANMAYSDPKIMPYVLNHRYGQYGKLINQHCFNDPDLYRREYYLAYPDQQKVTTKGSS